ncbi:AAA family ATPase [Verminephrobacter eiseniae]|uniref:ATPase AAA-type core domain-containing protein n=1 Tax=Verminephrobacter eiseniae (strain EF01-2) TaxID=391735 RepID=A1WF68_VEREI|nr:AAA family ATPase [Verminephrobacter eiseniae]ABM56275.1 conserved hypothetical protein [Verminephrobacter eiseniae EF01-2]
MSTQTNDATDAGQISRLVLRGYKSIAECDLELRRRNVLIGANGAGKSNFIGFFRLVHQILNQQLQMAVGLAGGPDALLHFGRKKTQELYAAVYFGDGSYSFTLQPTQDNRMMFASEVLSSGELRADDARTQATAQADLHEDLRWHAAIAVLNHPGSSQEQREAARAFMDQWSSKHGPFETSIEEQKKRIGPHHFDLLYPVMRSWRIYHFHDTSASASIKQIHNINDNEYLRDDARNLAAFLLRLKNQHEEHYRRIVKTIRLVAPFFGDFMLRPTVDNRERIQLEWTQSGQDEPFTASALSDGTLRFICLSTVLLQPQEHMPATILIDEPELGLHPFAISVLGASMKSAACRHQLIVSTQSVELVNEFDAQDLIVVDMRAGASIFKRPDAEALSEWLTEYSLGDLWKKNLLGGRPGR